MSFSIIALAIASFGIGTTELLITGLLPQIAQDLQVSIPAAGFLISAYAFGVVIGGPILTIITARWPRKRALLLMMSIFTAGNAFCAMTHTYEYLMIARILTALSHGAFFGIASVTAASMAPIGKRGQAIALVFAGLTLANVLGVPFGTAIGQWLGWRVAFWCVVLLGLASLAALAIWIPKHLPQSQTSILKEFVVLRQKPVLMGLVLSMLASISMFSVVTYLTPILEQVTQIDGHGVTLVFLLYGIGLTLGSFIGGRLSGEHIIANLTKLALAIFVSLLIMNFSTHSWLAMPLSVMIWGAMAFSICPLLQLLVVDRAAAAPNLASTLNQSAFNLGNALGAWISGVLLSFNYPLAHLPLIGAFVIFGLGIALLMSRSIYGVKRSVELEQKIPNC